MKNIKKLSHEEQALILAKREYHKKWRAKNKDKVKAANDRFYKKQAEKLAEQAK
ncbi:MAG: phosphatase [Oscillospiraceae bacterium]